MDREIILKRTVFGGFKRADIMKYIDELQKENERIKKDYKKELSLLRAGEATEKDTQEINMLKRKLKGQQDDFQNLKMRYEDLCNRYRQQRNGKEQSQEGKIQMYPGVNKSSIKENRDIWEEPAITENAYARTGSEAADYIPIPIDKAKDKRSRYKDSDTGEENSFEEAEENISRILKSQWENMESQTSNSFILNELYEEIKRLKNKLDRQQSAREFNDTLLNLQNENRRLRRKLEKAKMKNRELEAQLEFAGKMMFKRHRFL